MDLKAPVAALVVCVVMLTGCGAAGEARPDSRTPVPNGLEAGCPEPETEVRFPEGDLPEGATRVRLCPGPPLSDYSGEPVQGPPDLLTDAVSNLVSLVNRLDSVETDTECPFDGGPVLVYWFGYRDGDWRAVRFDSYGCNQLTLGEGLRRRGGTELAIAFTEALMSQRRDQEAPGVSRHVSCPVSPVAVAHSGLVLDQVELAAAVWCVSPRAQQVREVAIPPDLLARLNADLWPGLATKSRRPCPEAISSLIEGITLWGDAVGFGIGACGDVYPLHGATLLDDHGRHYLTPALDAALTALPLGPLVDHRN